jgi:hypothetical protein
MAISGESVFRITRWLGVNENPDGETALKAGEASEMRNFRITEDGSLQLRPGHRVISTARNWTGAIRGVWNGMAGNREVTLFAAGGRLWEYDFAARAGIPISAVGAFADAETHFFGFGGNVYMLNGQQYFVWTGTGESAAAAGYRPLILVSCPPEGGGTELERINKLNGERRARFSPTGSATVFRLPETELAQVDYVTDRVTGGDYAAGAYSVNLAAGTVTFSGGAPAAGVDSIEIGYTVAVTQRAEIEQMRFSEVFNGSSDNRVFLYGDGTNRTAYTGLDYDGTPRADYFPDLNVLDIGTANTPITALIRHYSQLAVFKTDGAFSVAYGTITLADGRTTAAFYWTPSNRALGCAAPGQAQLVENSPRTLAEGAVYDWRNGSSYAANLSSDERQARVVSLRVGRTLGGMDLAGAVTFNDRRRHEYYIVQNGAAVVHGYLTDTWYVYEPFDFTLLFERDGEIYGCTPDGDLAHISRQYPSDDGREIEAVWRSGALAFGQDFRRKYASRVFVTMKPEPHSQLEVSVQTDRHGQGAAGSRLLQTMLAGFRNANFRHWSFGTNRQPRTNRLKLRAKKFAYYQLLLRSATDWSTATVLAADVRLRYAGEVR